MIGTQSGSKVIWMHHAIHQQVLVAKTLPLELKEVMAVVVLAMNFIRGRAMNHCIFGEFCSEIGSELQAVLFYTEIRWLSKGKTLNRFLALREEIMHFLEEKQQSDLANVIDDYFMAKVYLADVFSELNNLTLIFLSKETTHALLTFMRSCVHSMTRLLSGKEQSVMKVWRCLMN